MSSMDSRSTLFRDSIKKEHPDEDCKCCCVRKRCTKKHFKCYLKVIRKLGA